MQEWIITQSKDTPSKGQLSGPLLSLPCALGRSGMVGGNVKQEGDGATPKGRFPVRRIFYRPDKVEPPINRLPVNAITPAMGWCDAPDHSAYNQLVSLPFGASHEKLWRDDDLYDLILVIGYNDAPVVQGAGSCIFLHVAKGDFEPTEGCASFKRADFEKLIRLVRPNDFVIFTD